MLYLILIIFIISILIYRYVVLPHKYWTKKGVLQTNPTFLIGDSLVYKNECIADFIQRMYDKYPTERYFGAYMLLSPILIIRDIELIKQIAVKDFDYFIDHKNFVPENIEPLWSKNLFSLRGERWKEMRATLSPAFTSSKMKAMFVLMSNCADRFTNYFVKHPEECNVELRDVFTRYTNDVIATCAFGVECDSVANKTNEFYMTGMKATNVNMIVMTIKFVLAATLPTFYKLANLQIFHPDVSSFFTNLISETVKYREENKVVRPDMVHLLMEARKGQLVYEEKSINDTDTGFATVEESSYGKSTKKQKDISDLDMTAQAMIFFFAGFDSVSSLMCFVGYELAINPEIQEKLHNEIRNAHESCDGNITYEILNKIKYLDMVVAETLRKWPAGAAVERLCVKDYTIEAKSENEEAFHLPKGSNVWFPIWGIHHDPNYYPNPDKFDPERFNDENKVNIKPYTYLPFGVGPRNCIASRFALLETKVLFYHLILKFQIVPNEKSQIPLVLVNKGFTIGGKKGFNFTIKSRC